VLTCYRKWQISELSGLFRFRARGRIASGNVQDLPVEYVIKIHSLTCYSATG